MRAETEINEGRPDGFSATINGQTIYMGDPVPNARQLLNAINYNPADDCVLIQVFAHGTRAIGLDETIDLREADIETFWAFRTDRIYRFTVDERGFDWGATRIKEPALRSVAHVDNDDILILERKDQPDHELGPDDEVDFANAGTEHLRTEKRLVTVFFKNEPFHIPRGVYSTEQLIDIFPIEEGYLLNLKTEDGELVTLMPEQRVHLRNGMRFFSQVPGGGSS